MSANSKRDTRRVFDREPAGAPESDDSAMPAELTVGQAAAWIRRTLGGFRLAITRGLLRGERRESPVQPHPYWVVRRADGRDADGAPFIGGTPCRTLAAAAAGRAAPAVAA